MWLGGWGGGKRSIATLLSGGQHTVQGGVRVQQDDLILKADIRTHASLGPEQQLEHQEHQATGTRQLEPSNCNSIIIL